MVCLAIQRYEILMNHIHSLPFSSILLPAFSLFPTIRHLHRILSPPFARLHAYGLPAKESRVQSPFKRNAAAYNGEYGVADRAMCESGQGVLGYGDEANSGSRYVRAD